MTRPLTTATAAFSLLHVVVIVAPAAMLAAAAHKGGLPSAHGIDLLLASGLIGGAHAVLVWRRLRAEFRAGVAFRNAYIAAFDALVVLALLSTGLFFVVLGGFAPEHAAIVNQGWPVVGLWVLVQLAAVGVAELVRTAVVRWLTEGARRPRATTASAKVP